MKSPVVVVALLMSLGVFLECASQERDITLSVEAMRHDFRQLQSILENEHCCLYEYTSQEEFDSLFKHRYAMITRPMRYEEFFRVIAPVAASVGCMHTALWMPGHFFSQGTNNFFLLRVRLIENSLVVAGSYRDTLEIPVGSIIMEINGKQAGAIVEELRAITSGDAYALPARKTRETADLHPADFASVRKVIFANFNHPPLTIELMDGKSIAVMTVKTFSYYDRVEYFKKFMDSSFLLIKRQGIRNLILDLRSNHGGDPFCAVILYSYLEGTPVPYFAEPYGKYASLADPIPIPENRFLGRLLTLVDGRCGSTNARLCALLKYHNIGEFVGTPSGATYKCNAGRNIERSLDNTSIILTFGRTTYAAAVEGMDKAKPILPDHYMEETCRRFLSGKDLHMETALQLIEHK